MRVWGRVYLDNEKIHEGTVAVPGEKLSQVSVEDFTEALSELCRGLDMPRPVILNKHKRELISCGRICFLQADFMEGIEADKLIVEVIP